MIASYARIHDSTHTLNNVCSKIISHNFGHSITIHRKPNHISPLFRNTPFHSSFHGNDKRKGSHTLPTLNYYMTPQTHAFDSASDIWKVCVAPTLFLLKQFLFGKTNNSTQLPQLYLEWCMVKRGKRDKNI